MNICIFLVVLTDLKSIRIKSNFMKCIFYVCSYIVMYLNEQCNDLILDFRLNLTILLYF